MSFTAMDLHSPDTASLLKVYGIGDAEIETLHAWKAHLEGGGFERVVADFYTWLQRQPEYEEFIDNPETERRLRRLQTTHLVSLVSGEFDDRYFSNRTRVGEVHARIGLPLHSYHGAMNHLCLCMLRQLPPDVDPLGATVTLLRVLHLDTALVALAYSRYANDRVAAQSKALLEMSTPVTEIWRGVLLLPIVGIIDSGRAQDIMTGALTKISSSRARVFIMDISGVAVVDTAVANYLIKVTRATRLMGCECIVSGVSPAIAETIVELGIDVGTIVTTGTLMQALVLAFDRVGLSVEQSGRAG
ncbi:MAG: STAS domain-containing protein [Deltaproteobacteria bacterium]|nr:STAS domain-containing protein [Deltaproteobacteria bacterium]